MTTEYTLKDPGTWDLIKAEQVPAFVAGEELAELADRDPRIVVLTADLAHANRTSDFAARHPERFFNVGISEHNMVSIAAGMAAAGHLPYVATFASFLGLMCAEQIRTDCAFTHQPVRLLATHSGFTMGFYGTSHHALEDLSILRTMADLVTVCATDSNSLRAILRQSLEIREPMYIRMGRGRDPDVYATVPEDFHIGKAYRLREGKDLTLIATGTEVHPSLKAAEMLAEEGVSARVVDMHTIKPFDAQEVLAAVRETAAIMTVEEHNITGGLGSAVAEVLAEAGAAAKFKRHGIHDEFVMIGPPAALYAHYKLDAAGVAATARAFLDR